MQAVETAFSVEEVSSARSPVQSTLVSWKKGLSPSIRVFAIGVSSIGGNDIIGGEAATAFAWNRYEYFDESDYVMELEWDRQLNMPLGGAVKALASVQLDNTSGRFTPRHMGGNSELYTAILPRRPLIINAGFHYNNVNNMIPQFVGVGNKSPEVNQRDRTVRIEAADFIDFLQNRYVDNTAMFTGQRSDVIIERILTSNGYQTADYELDTGVNLIDFALVETGQRLADVISDIVQAENGHFYQREDGKLIFSNRTRWASAPYNQVQRIISTSQVLDAFSESTDHLINVVEIKSQPRKKQSEQIIWKLSVPVELPVGNTELFINFDDPILAVSEYDYTIGATSDEDIDPTDDLSGVNVKSVDTFATAQKYTFVNTSTRTLWLREMTVVGRPAKVSYDLYYRQQDDSSVTAYEEQPIMLENNYIQSNAWAQSLATMILEDFSSPEKLQTLRIRAIPELQFGDLISWQGRHWFVYGIETEFSSQAGFIQTIKILQRTIVTYFQIGISTIGGSDKLAP